MSSVNLCKRPLSPMASIGLSGWAGLFISGAIATFWITTLGWSLAWTLSDVSPSVAVLWLLVRTVLHTGLFVIAHDAMHGNILPYHPVLNHRIGQIALGLYGFLPYQLCRQLHWQHHTYPAQSRDPDFYPKPHGIAMGYFVRWYGHFMKRYLIGGSLLRIIAGIGLTTTFLVGPCQVSLGNVVLSWIVPWVLSSLQLFTFGIFLPHYSGGAAHHQPKSHYYPIMWSLLICYHFSYHYEHHAFPHIPWYQLPYVSQCAISQCASTELTEPPV